MTGLTWRLSTGIVAKAVLPPPGVTGNLRNATFNGSDGYRSTLSYGTTAGKSNLVVWTDRTITAGSSSTFDLYVGTDLPDPRGATAAFRKLMAVAIWVESGGDTAGIVIGNAASNGTALWFDRQAATHTIYPSGPAFTAGQPAGLTVDATHKNLKIANPGAVDAVVRIYLAGTDV